MAEEYIAPGAEAQNSTGDITPIFANYMHTWIQAGTVRLTFGEVTGNGSLRYHTAVRLAAADAQNFANLILRLIAENPQHASYPAPQASPAPPHQET